MVIGACLRTALIRALSSLPGFSGSSAKPCPSGGIAPGGIPNACTHDMTEFNPPQMIGKDRETIAGR